MSTAFEFFENLQQKSWSGEVEVTSSQGHAIVYLRGGKFVWAHRPIDRVVERLKLISWIQLPDSEALVRTDRWHSFVVLLLNANPHQYAKLVQLLKVDRFEVFFRIFFWNNVELTLKPSLTQEEMDSSLGFYSHRQLDRLLLEARQRVQQWPQMKQKIGNSKRIFISQVDPKLLNIQTERNAQNILYSSDLKSEEPQIAAVPFSTEEIELLRLCNGQNSIQDLVRQLPYGEYLTVLRLLDLWRKGAVRPKDDEHSVVAIHTRESQMQLADVVSAVWVFVLVSFAYLGLSALKPQTPLEEPPLQLLQALEIHFQQHGNYPLTLLDLAGDFKIEKSLINSLLYSPLSNTEYELKLKPKQK